MKKLLLILTLATLSLTAFAQENPSSADSADENCNVAVVSGGGEPTESGGQPAPGGAGSARSE